MATSYWKKLTSCLQSLLLCFLFLNIVNCLHEDEVGKFDWHKQFIGIPKFVYHNQETNNIIIGTESNIIASIHENDGSVNWRQLLPKGCVLDHLSILKSSLNDQDFILRSSCTNSGVKKSHLWNPHNGLLSANSTIESITEDDHAESFLANSGHALDDMSVAFDIDNGLSLVVNQDGKVSLTVDGKKKWSREESLASVNAVEIVTLPVGMRDRFGLRKKIVLVTESGKIFGIDTLTGEEDWHLFDKDLSTRGSSSKTSLILMKQSEESELESRILVIHPNGLILQLNPITGKLIEKKQIGAKLKQIAQTELDTDKGIRGAILVDISNQVHIYPSSIQDSVKDNLNKYYVTIAEQYPAKIEGYKLISSNDKLLAVSVWNVPFNQTERIVNLGIKRIDEEVHSPARVLGDRGILYKYINPNLIAVMTQSTLGESCNPEHHISIYLIDGVTGSLVHSVFHPKSREPASMVHSENWLVYSYYNTKNRRTEVSSLEMFEGTVQVNSTAFSSLTRSSIRPKLIEHKSFIFPGGIDYMVDTVTLRSMTNRHIIVALPSGALLEIPKIFLDPRRPINMLPEHREEGLIPYMPELPIPSESTLNYHRTLLSIKKITTSPAILESTSLVFAYGLDFFFTRVTPSKTFDILKDDFDHLLITGVLIFLVVASYVSKLLAQRKALHAAWK